ncbi:hypothetical protein B0J13DRAFT_642151 [Dactylonectria estremocensis]|uniref:Major facilitator superfamily (MFS) profile domain-containing protein n=1 Tax=Dactylonectria estremocensis TaxID=1079267 RepID=A0A9P9E6C3_9HYPO|nr:hypothetical protein B0J13DRAFT_642151 [Dactylonectria estremocensis]
MISLLFLSSVIRFITSTLSSHVLHSTIGHRDITSLVSASQIIVYKIACFHLPFYVFVVAFAFIGLGAGLKNASWNVFISWFENSNELLGLLHPWSQDSFVDLDISSVTWLEVTCSNQPGALIRAREQNLTLKCFKNKVVILCSFYLLAYVGSEVALDGWFVTFVMKVKNGSASESGVRAAVGCHLTAAMALELMSWLIPNFVSSAICVSFLVSFSGPLFLCIIVCISRLLPPSMKTIAIGIRAAVGASGASIVPFLIGAIAEAMGVTVLQPIILVFMALYMLLWLWLPRRCQV